MPPFERPRARAFLREEPDPARPAAAPATLDRGPRPASSARMRRARAQSRPRSRALRTAWLRRLDRELAQDAPDVRADRVHRDEHRRGDLRGGEHLREVLEHLGLPLAEVLGQRRRWLGRFGGPGAAGRGTGPARTGSASRREPQAGDACAAGGGPAAVCRRTASRNSSGRARSSARASSVGSARAARPASASWQALTTGLDRARPGSAGGPGGADRPSPACRRAGRAAGPEPAGCHGRGRPPRPGAAPPRGHRGRTPAAPLRRRPARRPTRAARCLPVACAAACSAASYSVPQPQHAALEDGEHGRRGPACRARPAVRSLPGPAQPFPGFRQGVPLEVDPRERQSRRPDPSASSVPAPPVANASASARELAGPGQVAVDRLEQGRERDRTAAQRTEPGGLRRSRPPRAAPGCSSARGRRRPPRGHAPGRPRAPPRNPGALGHLVGQLRGQSAARSTLRLGPGEPARVGRRWRRSTVSAADTRSAGRSPRIGGGRGGGQVGRHRAVARRRAPWPPGGPPPRVPGRPPGTGGTPRSDGSEPCASSRGTTRSSTSSREVNAQSSAATA